MNRRQFSLRALLLSVPVAAILVTFAVPLSIIAYATIGPVLGATALLGTLILVQSPIMRMVLRRKRDE